MRVCVIIPMYNFNSMTDTCVEFCRKNAGIEHEILVVDDGSLTEYNHADKTISVLRLDKNGGFTKAVNEGLKKLNCEYDYVCLLNNDTEPHVDFLKRLVETAEEKKDYGIIGSARYIKDEDAIYAYHADLTTGTIVGFYDDPTEPIQCISIPFCCVLLSKKCVQYVGLLDEHLVNHCSDNDYCLRALMLNFGVLYEPRSKVNHHRSMTCKHNEIYADNDIKRFSDKWFGVKQNEILNLIPINHAYKKFGNLTLNYSMRDI